MVFKPPGQGHGDCGGKGAVFQAVVKGGNINGVEELGLPISEWGHEVKRGKRVRE